jgi:putative ATP-binding cassette transporter
LPLRPGEVVFLVGGNGSGKTTLAKLLCGLYAPEAGRIWAGSREVDDAHREAYRGLFSAVFADSWLFDRLYGLTGDATGLLQELGLASKVQIEGEALSTTALSQGQRRRLMLLAAILEDRPVYLFDEWAADQDPAFREVFYTRVLPSLRARGKAVFVISHDDRYFPTADRLLRLDYGQLSAGR